jgi:hypothetical protein
MFGTVKKLWRNFQRVTGRLDPIRKMEEELTDARLSLLEAQSGKEWAEAMVSYHTKRIERLQAQLHAHYVVKERELGSEEGPTLTHQELGRPRIVRPL